MIEETDEWISRDKILVKMLMLKGHP